MAGGLPSSRSSVRGPQFFFTHEQMFPNIHAVPRFNRTGQWRPPKAFEHNLRHPDQPADVFYYDGAIATQVSALPHEVRLYKTCSIYFDSWQYWLVDYNAIEHAVDDGRDHKTDPVPTKLGARDGREDHFDWHHPSFQEHQTHGHHRLSYVGHRLPHKTLRHQRPDQLWVTMLFPEIYQKDPRHRTTDRNHGAMIGELPLLIALAAMTLPPLGDLSVPTLLPRIMENSGNGVQWRITSLPRGAGWRDRRGLVISVYFDPDKTSPQLLEAYEQGRYGPIFP